MHGRTALISGIGIAGATLAYWLGQFGFTPTLVEQAPRPRTGGYVIDFWGRGYDIAEKMGLVPELKGEGYDIRELRIVDASGRRIGGFGVDVFRKLTHGRYVSIARADLARLIYRGIENRFETIFGDGIAHIAQDDDGVQVNFKHAAPRRFDFVIGADGLHSAVRKLVFGPEDRFEKYLGYYVAAFEVDGYPNRDEQVYVSYEFPGKQVARFAMREGRTLFLFVFAANEPLPIDPRDTSSQKTRLHAEFDYGGWECPQIMTELDSCDDLYFDSVSQIRLDSWSRGRVALVGDAAFCPSLLAGQGSALAMIAAYVLAGELATADRVQIAFRRYEQLLQPFIIGKQKAAERFARSFAPKTQFGLFVRNQVTKAFAIPLVASLTLGRLVHDAIDLPSYPG
ncbi:MAG: FAD-binding domain [Xanthobacteraceae bacterium]